MNLRHYLGPDASLVQDLLNSGEDYAARMKEAKAKGDFTPRISDSIRAKITAFLLMELLHRLETMTKEEFARKYPKKTKGP